MRCSSLITSSSTSTSVTPGTRPTASRTRVTMVSRIGQPETVSQTATRTAPPSPIPTDFTMPISVIGRLISGSLTVDSAWRTDSSVTPAATSVSLAMT